MTSSHHAPYDLGYTRATMDGSEADPRGRAEPINPFSVRTAACNPAAKLGPLVIADQHAAVNTFPGLVHRPSHHESQQRPKEAAQPGMEELSKAGPMIGVKS